MTKIKDLLSWNIVYEQEDSQKNSKKIEIEEIFIILEVWLSKKGRAGKIATILKVRGIDDMSSKKKEIVYKQMKQLLILLKRKLNCGGTFKNGEIILQYSNRDSIQTTLKDKKIKLIFCGG